MTTASSIRAQHFRSTPMSRHQPRWIAGLQRASGRRNRALCSALKTSCHFARLNTNSSVTPAGVRGFVIFNSSSVIDVTIRR